MHIIDPSFPATNPSNDGPITIYPSPDLEFNEKLNQRHSMPLPQRSRLPLARPHSIHVSSAQAYLHYNDIQYNPCENIETDTRNSISRSSLVSFANPYVRDVDPESIPTASAWPTMEIAGLTSFPSLISDQPLQLGSLSRASSGSENVQSSDAHAHLQIQRPRPISCAADFAGPVQSDFSISPISKKTPSSGHESMIETALSSIGHGSENLNVRQSSTRSSIIWSSDLDSAIPTSHRRNNARARVQNLSFKRVHRRAFMSLSTLEVRPKVKRDKSDRSISGSPFSGVRRAKTSEPSLLHSTPKEFQSVSMSSTFRSNIARSDGGHYADQRNIHRFSSPVTLLTSASDPQLLVRSASGTQDIVSPFEHWLNSNQNHRGSSHTINSLTGRRRSSLRLIGNSTLDSSGQMERSSFDTND